MFSETIISHPRFAGAQSKVATQFMGFPYFPNDGQQFERILNFFMMINSLKLFVCISYFYIFLIYAYILDPKNLYDSNNVIFYINYGKGRKKGSKSVFENLCCISLNLFLKYNIILSKILDS